MEDEGRAALEQSGVKSDGVVIERAADMRYVGQEHAVTVDLPGELFAAQDRAGIKARFDAVHRTRYGFSVGGEKAEIVSLRGAVIGEMRVIITPRDSNELFCLNLLDGSLVWKKPRGEGLFVAGIHQGKVLVVGRSYVQALNVADGEPAWPEPASLPIPSGRGFVAGDCLHLPLVTAEVATISLRDGRVLARARSLSGNVPGNLISIRGTIICQGADFVETYRQLDALETDIAEALARNPGDAQALALRGEIRLQHGRVAEAYADLKRALELKSDDAGVRSLLVGSLLEGLRVDFDSYRRLEADIEPLLTEPEERSAYLWLTAQGLKRAGESRAALAALLRFGDPDVADRELERLDGTLVVRRDRLVRARAAELYAAASSESRVEMDRDYLAQAGRLREKKDLGSVRRFLQYIGELADARPLQRLAVELPSTDGDWLADEFHLEPLCGAKDPDAAAAATARMAQLLLTAERPGDALPFIRCLERRWPQIACLDGKTGGALAAEWMKGSEIERELALDAPWPTGFVKIERDGPLAGNLPPQRSFEIPIAGKCGTSAHDVVLHVNTNAREFFARDGLGRQLWKVTLDAPIQQPMQVRYNRGYICGHFVLISIGAQVLAISPQSVDSHEGFAAKHGFTFPLLADTDKKVAALYGTLGPLGYPRRSVFVVDGDGVIRYLHRAIAGLTYRSTDELIRAVEAARSR
jgi:tetratricopeptide (TPR) repeat protein